MAKKKRVKKKGARKQVRKRNNLVLATISLLLNVLVFPLPGIGSLVGGRIKVGIWQLILGIVGDVLFVYWIGIPIWLFAWVWGIITGVQLMKGAK